MVKKLNIEKGVNLTHGLNSLLRTHEEEPEKEKVEDKESLIKTFKISRSDFDYINKYILYMGYKKKVKYTQQQVIHDAIALLKEKFPEVE